MKFESELEKEIIKKESSEEIERLHKLNSENRNIVILEAEKKGQRIIDSSIDYLKHLRLKYKICGFVFIILLYFIKESIAKVWNKNVEIEILSYGVYVPVLVAVFFGMALIVIESTAGIFGESKIPFVRKWFMSSLNRAVRSHAEYQDFSENQFGLVIEQVGSDLELVQHEFTKLDESSS